MLLHECLYQYKNIKPTLYCKIFAMLNLIKTSKYITPARFKMNLNLYTKSALQDLKSFLDKQ